ncbi:uncharacterized protein LOC134331872 [Trichomycterus rosablanca]|uniref:uncharacterized protein LOC134331872 n=1 Tax=Trichomycterus rosablanca TaxID=2290929 RepID=UPI002F35CFC3
MQSAFSRSRRDSGRESDESSLRGLRRKREFTPEEKKDASYWEKRRKNNEAAKRSREKRRANDYILETRLVALSEENAALRAELLALKLRYGLLSSSCPYTAHQRSFLQMHPYLTQTPNPCPERNFWERDKISQEPSQWPGYQHTPVVTAGSSFVPTHSFPVSRTYPYIFDVPDLLPSAKTPMVFAPVFPTMAASLPEFPLLKSGSQRTTIHKESEQQLPDNASAVLPHKLRLKNPKMSEEKGNRIKTTSPFPIYLSD